LIIDNSGIRTGSFMKYLRVLAPALAGVLALLPLFLLLGPNPWIGIAALIQGSLGSGEALTNTALKLCPLLLVGTGLLLGFKAGFWNIGGEGQFVAGAIGAAAWASVLEGAPQSLPCWMGGLVAGLLAGALWSLLAAWLRLRFGIQEVISTLMLNFVAFHLLSYLVHGPLQEKAGAYPQTEALRGAFLLPRLGEGRIHLMVLLAPLMALAALAWLKTAEGGFLVRASGQGPRAAAAAGIPTRKYLALAALVSGGFCGLAGAVEAQGVAGRVYEGFSAGYGYTAIAVVLLARLEAGGFFWSALFFAALASGAGWAQRSLGLPSVALFIVQAVVIAAAGLSMRRRS
jgi:simple sugar transport system permease protein